MLEENVDLICRKYTSLGEEEIAHIRKIAEALPFMAEQNKADAFLNCACEDGNSVIVAHARPDSTPSLYKDETIGLFSYPVSEPAVDRTLRLGIETNYVRAVTQEGSRVIQECFPVNYRGKTIAVLTYEKSPDDSKVDLSKINKTPMTVPQNAMEPPQLNWQWFLESALDAAFILVDMNGFVVYRNEEAQQLYKTMGYVEDILGQTYSNISFFRTTEFGENGYEEIQIRDKYLRSRIVPINRDNIAFAVFLNDITDTQETARELVLRSMAVQEMHHRIKNSLQTIISLINLQRRRSSSEEARADMQVISSRIQAIATTHQLLAQDVSRGRVSLRGVVGNIAHNVIRSQTTACRIYLTESGDDFEVSSDVATTVALVVNELLQNAIEHAFPGRRKGNISIEIIKKSSVYGSIVVRDDGIGVRDSDPRNLGSRIVRSLVKEKLKGILDVEGSDSGTTVTISFPIYE